MPLELPVPVEIILVQVDSNRYAPFFVGNVKLFMNVGLFVY